MKCNRENRIVPIIGSIYCGCPKCDPDNTGEPDFTDWPTLEEITEEVIQYRNQLQGYNPADLIDPGNPEFVGGDIRLQVSDSGSWSIHTGDSSFDTDHNGNWGASCVSVDYSDDECKETAEQLLNEAKEQYAENNC